MYTLLGERFAGWTGALAALTVGRSFRRSSRWPWVPLTSATRDPLAQESCRAHVLEPLRYSRGQSETRRPQLEQHRRRGVALAVATLVMTLVLPIPQFVILVVAGGLGAALLRTDP